MKGDVIMNWEIIKERPNYSISTNGDKTLHFNSRDEAAEYFKCHKSQIAYGRRYKKGNKKGWIFMLDKDIV